MAAPYIGSITLEYPLLWLRRRPKVLGADTMCRDGSVVSVRAASVSQTERFAKLRAQWITFSQLETLRAMAATANTYSMQPEYASTAYSFRFAAENGVSDEKHEEWGEDANPDEVSGYPTDIWSCTLNVIIVG